MNKTPLLEIDHLKVIRGTRTVLDIDHLEIQEGEVLAVIGPNGAGKSTLLLALARLLQTNSGEIRFRGQPGSQTSDLDFRRRIGLVLQDALLLDDSVANNVGIGLKFRRLSGSEIQGRVSHWLARLGIDGLAGRRARSLSGGEAQRASLARAFALQPELLLLDEPFSALDAPTRLSLVSDMQELLAETHQTAVFITHDLEEALQLGQRVAVLVDGRLRQEGRPDEVFNAPADPEVAAFVGVETILPGKVTGGEDGLVRVALDGFQAEAVGQAEIGRPVYVCLRPEDITLHPAGNTPFSSARNRLAGQITRLTAQGPLMRVTIDCGMPVVALVTRPSAREMELAIGMAVGVSFKSSAAHLIIR